MADDDLTDFEPWLERWRLTPDGAPFTTPYAACRLLPVRQGRVAAMLKIARAAQERQGAAVMAWLDGDGAAAVLAHAEDALLLERAQGPGDLVAMARNGRDEMATRIICRVVADLHRPRPTTPPPSKSLHELFRALREAPGDPRLARARTLAAELLNHPRDERLLHGDIHHYNILDFGPRGWLAIDPWGVVGERAYDYANVARNPDLETVVLPGRFSRQLDLIAGLAGLERDRLACWSYAHAGLSAAWQIEDGQDPAPNFQIMEVFSRELP